MSRIRSAAFALLEQELLAAGISDLSPAAGDVLFVVRRQGPIEPGRIAALTERDKSTVSQILRDLERAGFVERSVSVEDRRSRLIRATARARRVEPVFERISQKLNRVMFRGFGRAERRALKQLLDRVRGNLMDVVSSVEAHPKRERARG